MGTLSGLAIALPVRSVDRSYLQLVQQGLRHTACAYYLETMLYTLSIERFTLRSSGIQIG